MKPTTRIAAISIALIFAAGLVASAGQPLGKSVKPATINKNVVTYKVRIACAGYFTQSSASYRIVMTDQAGTKVAPAQAFIPGVLDYTFTEWGSVTGTRVARMERILENGRPCNIRPCVKTGTFLRGLTYGFFIVPLPYRFEAGTDID